MDSTNMLAANLALFGETISYVKADATTRSIAALVEREPVASLPETPGMLKPKFRVTVLNSVTAGITHAEFDKGTDKLVFPDRVGGADADHFGWEIAAQCPSGMILELL